MKKSAVFLVIVSVVVALAAPYAYADAQTINFRCIMQYCHNQFYALAGVAMYNPETADSTTEGCLGMLDATEFELLGLILANPSAPNHAAIHAAFAQNAAAVREALTSTIINLTTSNSTSGPTERQPIPGTDPQAYYCLDGLMGAYVTLGAWDIYDTTMCGLNSSMFGPGPACIWGTVPGESDAYQVNYDMTNMSYISTCGDADGDGLTNQDEWELVVAAGFGVYEFLIAATDPNIIGPGSLELPAAGVLAAGLLAATVLALAARSLRRRDSR